MVGVAGRSKGCVTCRKRKKGVSDLIFGCRFYYVVTVPFHTRLMATSVISNNQNADSARSEVYYAAGTILTESSYTITLAKNGPQTVRQVLRTPVCSQT
jgi:hypothetical protein